MTDRENARQQEMKKITVKQLAELAQESEISDPIDWGLLAIKEETAYRLMASDVIDYFESLSDDEDQTKEYIMMATITKLLVENFVLNVKYHSAIQQKKN
jgi:hypothetical protein